MVGQRAHVEAALVEHGPADVAHGHHPHAGRGQQEGERPADLAEALQHHPAADERDTELAQHVPGGLSRQISHHPVIRQDGQLIG